MGEIVGSGGMSMTFEQFLDQRLRQLARLATVLCGDRATGEDVLQEVLLRTHQLWPRISIVDSPYGYVRKMLVHEHLAWCRKWDRQVPVAHVDIGHREPDPAIQITDRADLRERLGDLAPQQRAAIVLRYFADLSDAEIAEALECSPVTVRSYISRALSALRVALHSELAEYTPSRKDN
jgi:RNA polymerase sigma-70 factor (sigma-E family)